VSRRRLLPAGAATQRAPEGWNASRRGFWSEQERFDSRAGGAWQPSRRGLTAEHERLDSRAGEASQPSRRGFTAEQERLYNEVRVYFNKFLAQLSSHHSGRPVVHCCAWTAVVKLRLGGGVYCMGRRDARQFHHFPVSVWLKQNFWVSHLCGSFRKNLLSHHQKWRKFSHRFKQKGIFPVCKPTGLFQWKYLQDIIFRRFLRKLSFARKFSPNKCRTL